MVYIPEDNNTQEPEVPETVDLSEIMTFDAFAELCEAKDEKTAIKIIEGSKISTHFQKIMDPDFMCFLLTAIAAKLVEARDEGLTVEKAYLGIQFLVHHISNEPT